MKWHPDKNKEDPKAQERFQDLSNAYEVCFHNNSISYTGNTFLESACDDK